MKILNKLLLIIGFVGSISGTSFICREKEKRNEKYVTMVQQDKYKPSFNKHHHKNHNFKHESIPTLTISIHTSATSAITTKVSKITSIHKKRDNKYVNDKKMYKRTFLAPMMTKIGNTVKPTFAPYIGSQKKSCANQLDCYDKDIPNLLVEHLRDKKALKPKEIYHSKTLSIKPACKDEHCKKPIITSFPCLHGNCHLTKEEDMANIKFHGTNNLIKKDNTIFLGNTEEEEDGEELANIRIHGTKKMVKKDNTIFLGDTEEEEDGEELANIRIHGTKKMIKKDNTIFLGDTEEEDGKELANIRIHGTK